MNKQHTNVFMLYGLGLTCTLILLQLSYLFKVNVILGSHEVALSGFSILGPLVGLYGGGVFSIAVFVVKSLFSGIFNPASLLSPLTWHLPTIASSLYWATNSRVIRLFVPLFCIGLFIMHPIGLAAMEYSLFWFIPVIVYFMRTQNLFANALACTFIAHGVGSVVWLYTIPMASEQWLALIPMVLVERLLFAVGMVIVCKAVTLCRAWIAKGSCNYDPLLLKTVKSVSH